MSKPYAVRIPEEGPLFDALMEATTAMQQEAGVSGLSPAKVLSQAHEDPDVQAALIARLEAFSQDGTETMATILERDAEEEEKRAAANAQAKREKARALRGGSP